MPRNGDAGLTATRGRTVPPCRKGSSSRTGRMPTARPPVLLPAAASRGSGRGSRSQPRHGQALRQLLRQGQAQGPPPVQSHGQHSADAQLGPSRLLRQGPQAQVPSRACSAAVSRKGPVQPKAQASPSSRPSSGCPAGCSTPTGLPGSRRQKWKSAAAGKSSSPAGKCHCAGTASPAGDRGLNSSAASSASVIPPCRITRPALPAFGPSPAP